MDVTTFVRREESFRDWRLSPNHDINAGIDLSNGKDATSFVAVCTACDIVYQISDQRMNCCSNCGSADIRNHPAKRIEVAHRCGHNAYRTEIVHGDASIHNKLIFWGGQDCIACSFDNMERAFLIGEPREKPIGFFASIDEVHSYKK